MPGSPECSLVLDCRNLLGEGPSWDRASETLLWVDIRGRLVQRLDLSSGRTATRRFDQMVSAVLPRRAGGLAVALEDGIWVMESDMAPARRLAAIESGDSTTRLNDGKCDGRGRLWIGSMGRDSRPGAGSLYRVDPDGSVARVLAGVTISNGIAWSPDGYLMYYIDSATRRIDVFDYEPGTGRASGRRPLIEIPEGAGLPDGMAVDAEGGLWVALWDGWAVRRYTASGILQRVVDLPVGRVTSCAFGGPALADLYVTSARDGLSDADSRAQPQAGGLFVIRPDVVGLAAVPFGG